MSLAFILVCLWAILANVLAMLPSKDYHWRSAYFLLGLVVPLIGYVIIQHGLWAGLLVLVGACWILRYPVLHFGRWLRKALFQRDKTRVE